MSATKRDAQGTGVSAWSYLKRHGLKQGSGLVLQVNAHRAQMAHCAEIAEAGFLSDFTNRRRFDGLSRFDRARRQLHAGVRMSKNQDVRSRAAPPGHESGGFVDGLAVHRFPVLFIPLYNLRAMIGLCR